METKKILVIEDNPTNMELITDLLEAYGYQVIGAATAGEGIIQAQTVAPNLILMDLSLPDMDGLDATWQLKQDEATQHIPIVALTAHALKEFEAKSLEVGCAGYITKPIDTRTLPKAVARLLAEHQAI